MSLFESVIYRRVAPVVLALTLVLAIGAAVGTYVNDRNDRDRDRAITAANTARLADNAELLACFDDFATALAGGLPPVRAASAARDEALRNALSGLRDVLAKAVTGDIKTGDVRRLLRLFAVYTDSSDQLDQVRGDNPYPEPPSEFCSSSD